MTSRRFISIGAVAMLVCLTAVSGCKKKEAEPAAPAAPAAPDVEKAVGEGAEKASAVGETVKLAAKGEVINAMCPMMDNDIDPSKVPADLTREWKGVKVGFCCPACLGAWDKLSDEQKLGKLSAAAPGKTLPKL